MYESGASRAFFHHGLGHHLGLDVSPTRRVSLQHEMEAQITNLDQAVCVLAPQIARHSKEAWC